METSVLCDNYFSAASVSGTMAPDTMAHLDIEHDLMLDELPEEDHCMSRTWEQSAKDMPEPIADAPEPDGGDMETEPADTDSMDAEQSDPDEEPIEPIEPEDDNDDGDVPETDGEEGLLDAEPSEPEDGEGDMPEPEEGDVAEPEEGDMPEPVPESDEGDVEPEEVPESVTPVDAPAPSKKRVQEAPAQEAPRKRSKKRFAKMDTPPDVKGVEAHARKGELLLRSADWLRRCVDILKTADPSTSRLAYTVHTRRATLARMIYEFIGVDLGSTDLDQLMAERKQARVAGAGAQAGAGTSPATKDKGKVKKGVEPVAQPVSDTEMIRKRFEDAHAKVQASMREMEAVVAGVRERQATLVSIRDRIRTEPTLLDDTNTLLSLSGTMKTCETFITDAMPLLTFYREVALPLYGKRSE